MKEIIRKIRKLAIAGKYNEALELLETIPKQYMTSDMWVKRGIYMQLGDGTDTYSLADAKESFKRAIALNPNNVEAMIELGYFLYAVEDNAIDAKRHFRKAVNLLSKLNNEALSGIKKCVEE